MNKIIEIEEREAWDSFMEIMLQTDRGISAEWAAIRAKELITKRREFFKYYDPVTGEFKE